MNNPTLIPISRTCPHLKIPDNPVYLHEKTIIDMIYKRFDEYNSSTIKCSHHGCIY